MNRAERRVELEATDRSRLFLERRALRRRAVAATTFDLEHHVQLADTRQVRDDEIRIHDLYVMIQLDVTRGDRARALFRDPQFRRVTRIHADRDLLQVEENVDDILLHAFDTRVWTSCR